MCFWGVKCVVLWYNWFGFWIGRVDFDFNFCEPNDPRDWQS